MAKELPSFASKCPRVKVNRIRKLLADRAYGAIVAYVNLEQSLRGRREDDRSILWLCVKCYVQHEGYSTQELEAAFKIAAGLVAPPE
jgi:hypothetical protein